MIYIYILKKAEENTNFKDTYEKVPKDGFKIFFKLKDPKEILNKLQKVKLIDV